jgi:hypothetical protein
MKQELVNMSKSTLGAEAALTTVVFLPPDDSNLGAPLEQQADEWRWAVKSGGQQELGQPHQYIGAKLVSCINKMISRGPAFTENTCYGKLISHNELETWMQWHQEAKSVLGLFPALDESLSEIIVRRKGPRMFRGELADDSQSDDRIMLKIRPHASMAAMWRPVLFLVKAVASDAGGYTSLRQPIPQAIKKMQNSSRGGYREQWE